MILYSLHRLNSNSLAVRQLLSSILPLLSISIIPLDHQAIGNSLYGLAHMNSQHEEVRQILSCLISCIDLSLEKGVQLSGQEFSNALFGLQSFKLAVSEGDEVNQLVGLLSRFNLNGNKSMTGFGSQALAMCLFGLQQMNSSSENLQRLLSSINNQIDLVMQDDRKMGINSFDFSSQSIAMMVKGLKSMSTQDPQVRPLLKRLTRLITMSSKCRGGMTAGEVASTFSGLAVLGGGVSCHPESKHFLECVLPLVKRKSSSYPYFTGSDLSVALSGLKGLSDSDPYLFIVMKILMERLDKTTPLSFKELSMCLHYIKQWGDEQRLFLPELISSLHRMISMTDFHPSEHYVTGQGIAMAVSGLSKSLSMGHKEAFDCLGVLVEVIDKQKVVVDFSSSVIMLYSLKGVSDSDRMIFPSINRLLDVVSNSFRQATNQSVEGVRRVDEQMCSMSLYGLNKMHLSVNTGVAAAGDESIRSIVSSVGQLITSHGEEVSFDHQAISMGLYGIRHLDPQVLEVRNLLLLFARKISAVTSSLNGFQVAKILRSLSQMNVLNEDVERVVFALSKTIKSSSKGDLLIDDNDWKSIQKSLNKMDKSLYSVQILLDSLNRRIRTLEPSAKGWMPLLVGFFLAQEQLDYVMRFIS